MIPVKRKTSNGSLAQPNSDATEFQFSANVLGSILSTRMEQLEAVTLPTDSHRLDIIHAIQEIPSFQRRLTCFLDYLIDYAANLNLELERTQEALSEAELKLSSVKSKKTNFRQRHFADYEHSLSLLAVKKGSLTPAIQALLAEKIDRRKGNGIEDEPCRDVAGIAEQLSAIDDELSSFGVDFRRKLCRSARQ
jgi:hypothetical protein